MRYVVCVCAMSLIACASGGGGNEPQSGVKNLGTIGLAGRDSRADAHGVTSVLTQGLAPIYTAPDLGWQVTVPAPVDAAFHAVIEGYGGIGIELQTIDVQARVVGNKRIVAPSALLGQPLSKFLNCGRDGVTGQPRADSYRVVFSIVSSLSGVDSASTRVTTLVTAEAADRGTTASTVTCSSTGVLERALLRAAGYPASLSR
jgi:hypothetical protein